MTRDVDVTPFRLPLTTPLETATGSIEERRGFLLEVDGAVGEATPLRGWTESLEACRVALDTAAAHLRNGESWREALDCCAEMPAARHAVDLARADLDATRADAPLASYLSSDDYAPTVPVNATIGQSPVRETAAHARSAVTSGFDCLKVKVGGRPVPGDVERLRAVRTEVGTDVELRADANGSWTPGQAREAMDAFDDLGVRYVEQPLPADDLTALADLRHDATIGVAVDETLASHRFGDVLMAGAADVVVLKPMALGGIERAHAYALRARELDVTPVVTTTVDGVVARTAALHLAASLGDPPACGLATADRLGTDLAPDPAPVENGRMTVPTSPGLGIQSPRVPTEATVDE